MNTYGSFADIYDRLMDDFDYPAWADLYWQLLTADSAAPRSLCECACGTGSLTIPLSERCGRLIGADLSEDMLRIAAEKARRAGAQIRFIRQDMCALTLPRPVEAILCTCDGLNYLTTTDRVRSFFRAAAANLKKGGTLAFDISSEYKLEHILGNAFYGEDRDDITYLWSNRWDAASRLVTMDLTFFTREPGGLFRRFREEHIQRAHTPEELIPLLEGSGFTDIRIYGERSMEPPASDSLRLHFVAKHI